MDFSSVASVEISSPPCSIVGSLVTFELHKNNLLSSKLFTTTSIFGVTHLFFVTKVIEKNTHFIPNVVLHKTRC